MKTAVSSLAAILLSASAACAVEDKFSITPEEHAACDADAISLCADSYPDEDRLLVCMKLKQSQLSSACHAAFTTGLKKRGIPL